MCVQSTGTNCERDGYLSVRTVPVADVGVFLVDGVYACV